MISLSHILKKGIAGDSNFLEQILNTKVHLKLDTKVVILTGAGISAESGLKTFRDNDGLWETHAVEDVATPEAFARNPQMVWRFYKQRYFQLSEVVPNPGHTALAQLEEQLEDRFTLITQNVDGLHSLVGNKRVFEMHGSLKSCFCSRCKAEFKMERVDLTPEIPLCPSCGGKLRPDIVWFGETPYQLEELFRAVYHSNVFVVVGTSGYVYPAAQFLEIAKQNGAYTVGVNLERPLNSEFMDEFHQGRSGDVLPELIKKWIKQ